MLLKVGTLVPPDVDIVCDPVPLNTTVPALVLKGLVAAVLDWVQFPPTFI